MEKQPNFKIMENIKLAKKSKYFKSLDEMDFNALMHCLNCRIISFNKGDTIVNIGDNADYAYLFLTGNARSVTYDVSGNIFFNLDYEKDEVFGLVEIIEQKAKFSKHLFCLDDSLVLLMSRTRLINMCQNRCLRHIQLLKLLFKELARQNDFLSNYKNLLTLKTTRDKIIRYLVELSKKKKSKEFNIPYSRQDMALFLGVERSALSYELSKLKKEGYIDFNKNHFVLLKS